MPSTLSRSQCLRNCSSGEHHEAGQSKSNLSISDGWHYYWNNAFICWEDMQSINATFNVPNVKRLNRHIYLIALVKEEKIFDCWRKQYGEGRCSPSPLHHLSLPELCGIIKVPLFLSYNQNFKSSPMFPCKLHFLHFMFQRLLLPWKLDIIPIISLSS